MSFGNTRKEHQGLIRKAKTGLVEEYQQERTEFRPWCKGLFHTFFFCYGMSAALFDSSNPDWAPTLNMGYEVSSSDVGRSIGSKRRKVCASPTSPSESHPLYSISSASSSSLPLHQSLTENEDSQDGKQVDVSCQTDFVSVTDLERDYQCLRSEVAILKCSKGSITPEAFMNNSELFKILHWLT